MSMGGGDMKSKQVLSIEQMQHLQELGLELKETTLYWVVYEAGHENNFVTTKENAMEVIDESCGMLPAYTLQDVLDAMTRWEINDGFCPRITIDLSERLIRYHYKDKDRVSMVMKSFDSTGCLIDAAYEMLCWAIKKKFVETNKNE